MSNHDFDKEIRQKMGEHQASVPTDVWQAIANKKKKRRRFMLIWWIPVVLAVFFLLYRYANDPGDNSDISFDSKETSDSRKEKISTGGTSFDNSPIHQSKSEEKETLPNHSNEETDHENVAGIDNKTISNDQTRRATGSIHQQQWGSNFQDQANITDGKSVLNQHSITNFQTIRVTNSGVRNNSKNHKTLSRNNQINADVQKESLDLISPLPDGDLAVESVQGKDFASQTINYKGNLIDYHKSGVNTNSLLIKVSIQQNSFNQTVKNELNRNRRFSKRSRWSLEAGFMGFMPLRVKQDVIAINRTTTEPMHIAEFNGNRVRINLQSSTAGFVAVRKKVNRKISFGVGLQYGTIKEEIIISGNETNLKSHVVQRLENDGSGPHLVFDTITVTSTGTREIEAINSYRFLDVPVSMHFAFLQNSKLSLSLTATMNIGLYSLYNNSIQGELQPVYANGNSHRNASQAVRTEFSAGLRFARPVFLKTEIFAEPYLRFNTGGYKKTIINHNAVHQIGIGLGVAHRF